MRSISMILDQSLSGPSLMPDPPLYELTLSKCSFAALSGDRCMDASTPILGNRSAWSSSLSRSRVSASGNCCFLDDPGTPPFIS